MLARKDMLSDELKGLHSLAIIGMQKNAGKTTVLNRILEEARRGGDFPRPLAITSIGRDGEEKDVVTSTVKPKIYIERGTLVATASSFLSRCKLTKEILASTQVRTALGEVVLFRALSDGFVEIAGPSSVEGVRRIKEAFLAIDPDCFYLVDGAISRKSTAGHFLTEGAILCTGASLDSSMGVVVKKTAAMVEQFLLPGAPTSVIDVFSKTEAKAAICRSGELVEIEGDLAFTMASDIAQKWTEDSEALLLRGVITESFFKNLLQKVSLKGVQVVIEDATRLFVSEGYLDRLKRQEIILEVFQPIELRAVCLNPFSPRGVDFQAQAFLEEMRQALPVPVYDVRRM
ncbi:MAG TPA: hypothetical protein GX733_00825 [Tissierellia bacterium]|nr:hypothetical protein [Tissierellia bacterium]